MHRLTDAFKNGAEIDWNLLEEYNINSKLCSINENEHLIVCKSLLSRFEPNLINDKRKETIFDTFIVKDNINAFIIVFNYLMNEYEASLKRDKYLQLLCKFVFEGNTFENLLLKKCHTDSDDNSTFETILVSFPENVANQFHLNTPKKCLPIPYFTHLSKTIFKCLSKVRSALAESKSMSLRFISAVCGRILFNNHTDIVWKYIFYPLMIECQNDFIWRRISHRLVEYQNDRYLEHYMKPIFCSAPNFRCIFWLIDKYVERSEKLKYILTNKLLLAYCSDDNKVVRNVIQYLAVYSKVNFLEAVRNILNAWCNSLSIKHRSNAQHLYLASALVVASQYLKNGNFEEYKQEYTTAAVHGIELYLKCSITDVRNIGLFVGQTFLSSIQSDGPKLDFEIEDTPEIKRLKTIYNDSIEDDDENLNIFEEHQEIDEDKNHCMNGLIEENKPEWTILCLQSAADVIKANADTVPEIAVEFARILLYLDDTYNLNDFIILRFSAMVNLCVVSPQLVAEFLTSQFYERNISISRRLDILEVLAASCRQIANPSKTQTTKVKELSLPSKETSIDEENWKAVINARVKEKTKIIASKPREIEIDVNRFASVASYFFFPLMKNYDRLKVTLNLVEEDHYILGKLLYTLGITLHSAAQTWPSRQMGKSLLEFLWLFRYHQDAFVRQAVIYCLSVVITSVPSVYLFNELQNELLEFQKWLVDVMDKDPNAECAKRSFQALNLLKSFIQTNVT
ncbi:hypothetical protein B4U79_11852 [Dinothrombium tinctorium]|uniref:Telomere length regulation protein conserved domain-containing protein n=1 Tax=Dinothrombium tinctorium TaxID=1965070 RepID=A0A3S3PQY9_9ACAR|nr:hypothetical protein B4U79_10832 [Dinothrombium tinctorium]RWS17490.1 hypothetical protein B4U79_11852 [Dinothrombium tinctorium]